MSPFLLSLCRWRIHLSEAWRCTPGCCHSSLLGPWEPLAESTFSLGAVLEAPGMYLCLLQYKWYLQGLSGSVLHSGPPPTCVASLPCALPSLLWASHCGCVMFGYAFTWADLGLLLIFKGFGTLERSQALPRERMIDYFIMLD